MKEDEIIYPVTAELDKNDLRIHRKVHEVLSILNGFSQEECDYILLSVKSILNTLPIKIQYHDSLKNYSEELLQRGEHQI